MLLTLTCAATVVFTNQRKDRTLVNETERLARNAFWDAPCCEGAVSMSFALSGALEPGQSTGQRATCSY